MRRATQAFARQQLATVNPKFGAGENELEAEARLRILQPRTADQLKQMKKNVELARLEAQGLNDTALDNALGLWESQILTGELADDVKFQFVRRFYFWLLGRGTDDDHAKTFWGRGNAAVINREVGLYIEQFAQRRLDFALQLSLLANRVPASLLGYWLYFKYIVGGAIKRVQKGGVSWWDMSDENYLADFELFVKYFDKNVGYGPIIAGAQPPGTTPPFDASRPYPFTPAQMELPQIGPAGTTAVMVQREMESVEPAHGAHINPSQEDVEEAVPAAKLDAVTGENLATVEAFEQYKAKGPLYVQSEKQKAQDLAAWHEKIAELTHALHAATKQAGINPDATDEDVENIISLSMQLNYLRTTGPASVKPGESTNRSVRDMSLEPRDSPYASFIGRPPEARDEMTSFAENTTTPEAAHLLRRVLAYDEGLRKEPSTIQSGFHSGARTSVRAEDARTLETMRMQDSLLAADTPSFTLKSWSRVAHTQAELQRTTAEYEKVARQLGTSELDASTLEASYARSTDWDMSAKIRLAAELQQLDPPRFEAHLQALREHRAAMVNAREHVVGLAHNDFELLREDLKELVDEAGRPDADLPKIQKEVASIIEESFVEEDAQKLIALLVAAMAAEAPPPALASLKRTIIRGARGKRYFRWRGPHGRFA